MKTKRVVKLKVDVEMEGLRKVYIRDVCARMPQQGGVRWTTRVRKSFLQVPVAGVPCRQVLLLEMFSPASRDVT